MRPKAMPTTCVRNGITVISRWCVPNLCQDGTWALQISGERFTLGCCWVITIQGVDDPVRRAFKAEQGGSRLGHMAARVHVAEPNRRIDSEDLGNFPP